ncbi:MAG: permease-like cell division protein FtsX [Eggerthellaceae bacterium]|jgi:cell division transport system permease protein|nr:permease-like cell division protein FtsX [Eubacterium sp.]
MRTSNVTYLVKKGISSIWKNFLMSFASFCILMVSLLLVSCAVLLMMNVNKIMSNIEDTNEITIYLKEDISDKQVEHIKSVLEKNQDITDVKYYSKEQALDDFRDNMAEYSELLDYLDKNPMPETFLVRVKDLSKIRHVVNTVNDIEGVEQTKAPYDFASVLVQIRNTFTLIGGAVLVALVVVSIVIVSNSIRTSVFARRNEISIMRYVGATSGFIKAPFFVEGMFIGILAGAAAWGLTWLIYDSVFALFSADLTVWQMFGFYGLTPFGDIMWYVLAVNCAAGALLGAVGTVFSTGKYLKV